MRICAENEEIFNLVNFFKLNYLRRIKYISLLNNLNALNVYLKRYIFLLFNSNLNLKGMPALTMNVENLK